MNNSGGMLKHAMRGTKNLLYGYSDIQIKIREATSNDPTGPTMSQMEFLSSASNSHGMLNEMIKIMDKRLNDHGKNWRHVYKTLILLEYMICCGHEMVVNYAKDRLYMINTLKEFQHLDSHGYDQGANVRAKSRDIVDLLADDELLAQARATRSIPQLRRKSNEPLTLQPVTQHIRENQAPAARPGSYQDLQQLDEDAALALALRESKEMHDRELSRSRSGSMDPNRVYPNFLDNVSRASLAKSNGSQTNSHGKVQSGELKPAAIVDSLLDLSDEDFGHASAQNPRSQSMGPQDLNALYSLNMGQPQAPAANPFVPAFEEADPFQAAAATHFDADPFANVQDARANSLPMNMAVPMNTAVPLPVAPGQAPVNHMSVSGNNVGAKPVLPHQMAPQYGYTAGVQSNQLQQNAARDQEDPFAQL